MTCFVRYIRFYFWETGRSKIGCLMGSFMSPNNNRGSVLVLSDPKNRTYLMHASLGLTLIFKGLFTIPDRWSRGGSGSAILIETILKRWSTVELSSVNRGNIHLHQSCSLIVGHFLLSSSVGVKYTYITLNIWPWVSENE